jgi:hypothetical protein
VKELLAELEVPFCPEQVQWRVTNTTNKKRGQVVPYADPRAYTDRLNALLSPQGWTREYKVETMSNITRIKKGESILSGKVLVTCTVTIPRIGSHSGTGEEWADDDNSVTSADAQAFKRACSCFGLGRYFYDIPAIWVDLDQNRQPAKTPVLSAWALPENCRKGMRPRARNGDGKPRAELQGKDPKEGNDGGHKKATSRRDGYNGESGDGPAEKLNGSSATNSDDELDQRILGMEKAVGSDFYRNILREYGRVDQPRLIRDATVKQRVLLLLESVARGIDRLEAVLKRIDPNTVQALLTKLQVSSLGQIADIKTLQNVVLGLEEVAGPIRPQAA